MAVHLSDISARVFSGAQLFIVGNGATPQVVNGSIVVDIFKTCCNFFDRVSLTTVVVYRPEFTPSAVYAPNPVLHYDFGDLFNNVSGTVTLPLDGSHLPVSDFSLDDLCMVSLTLIEYDISDDTNQLNLTLG